MADININGDFIDNITSRGGRNSGLTFLGNFTIKALVYDLSHAWPPEKYVYERGVDHVYIGNHFGFQIQMNFGLTLKGSAIPPNIGLWEWSYYCDYQLIYPDGYSKSGRIILGGESLNPATILEKDVSFPVTFSSTIVFNNQQRCTVTEDTSYNYYPPFVTLDLYEIIPFENQQTISLTVTGLTGETVTENTHLLLADATTEYDYTIDTKIFSSGATAGVQPLQINNLTLNQLAIPDYTYLHVVNSNNYFYQTTGVDAKIQGTDDVFGTPVYNFITANTSVTLERSIVNRGTVNAWQNSYPNQLVCNISKFDMTGRSFAFTGSFNQNETFQKYQFDSVINIAGTANTKTQGLNTLPTGYIQNTITSASLIANGDYSSATRFPFRAWWKPGADIYHVKNTVLAGSGNTRTYPNGYSFASYRFLEVTAGNATTLPQTGKLIISQNGTNKILEKDLTWPVGTSTTRIDTCFGGIAHTLFPDIQGQDNPYPRVNTIWGLFPGSGTALTINQDMYGVGQIQSVSCTGNITVSQFKLTRDDNTGKASFIPPFSSGQGAIGNTFNGFVNWQTNSPTRSFYSRRFWEQDVQGKNEEEWDVEYQYFLGDGSLAGVNDQTVEDICDSIQNRKGRMPSGNLYDVHKGWIASPSYVGTGSTLNLDSIYAKTAAYACWLNGNGLQYTEGNAKYSILRDLSQEYGDRDIFTQMIFDRLNCNYPPDYFDAFQIEAPGETSLQLYSFSCLRSAAHGLVQERLLGEVVGLASTTGANWGSASTDVFGSYQTGTPGGKAQNRGVVTWSTNSYTIPRLFTSKRSRVAFYAIPVPSTVKILSADMSGFYQQCIGTVDAGNVKLIFTDTIDFSTFDTLTTNITGMDNVAIAWLEPTYTNQMVLITQRTSDSAILRYTLDDFVNGVASMATVIGNGTTPAIAINNNGTQIIFWRTSSSNIQRIIIDAQGNVSTTASNVVTGNVEDKGLGCYWRDDVPYLVYNHTTNGLTVVKSENYGQTFS